MLFSTWKRISSTSHRDPHPLRVSPVRFVLWVGHGGERAESVFSCVVALVFVRTLSPKSSRGTTSRVEPARLRRSSSKVVARKSGDTGDKQCLKQDAPVTTTQAVRSDEIRKMRWLSALRGLRYPGVSPVTGTGKQTLIVVGGN